MTNALFRPDAIEQQRHRLHGDVLLLPRFSHSILLGILLLWITSVMVWLCTSTFARKETVNGWLEPPSGVVRVYPEDPGIIKTVLVSEGDQVTAGQPLVIINGDRMLSSGDNLESSLLEEYEIQRTLLQEQFTRTNKLLTLRTQDTAQRIAAAEQELAMINMQINIVQQRYALIEKQVQRYRELQAAGHASTAELDNTLTQELTLRNDKQALIRNQISQKNLIEQLQTQQRMLPDESANQLNELRERLSNIAQQIARISGQRSHIIEAPRDGIINNLQAIEGQQAQPGSKTPLLTLIGKETRLSIQLLVPVRAIGFIEPDQKINIRYDAFPYQKFGIYSAKIHSVSKTLLLPDELLHVPISIREPAYRVTALLDHIDVQAYGKAFALKPGMTLSADVRLSERSLIQWLLEPIYSLHGRL